MGNASRLDGGIGGLQGLTEHLTAKHLRAADIAAAAAKQIDLEPFQLEQAHQFG